MFPGNYKTNDLLGIGPKKKKRKSLTPAQKLWQWENNQHICHICGKRISKLSEAEFDHKRAHSKGGTTMALAHRTCNRLKSNKSTTQIRKTLGIKTKTKRKTNKKKTTKKKRKIQTLSIFGTQLPEYKPPKLF